MAKRNPFAAIAHGHSLAEAIVDAIREPLLVLDLDLRVIAASRSFYRTFAVTPRKTEGRLVFELGDGQWNIPRLRALLEDIIPKRRTVEAYEVEHEFPSIGRRVIASDSEKALEKYIGAKQGTVQLDAKRYRHALGCGRVEIHLSELTT